MASDRDCLARLCVCSGSASGLRPDHQERDREIIPGRAVREASSGPEGETVAILDQPDPKHPLGKPLIPPARLLRHTAVLDGHVHLTGRTTGAVQTCDAICRL